MVEILFQPVHQLTELLRRKELSSEELVRAALERIRARDGEIHAFNCVLEEEALATARQVDQLRARGEILPPFAGVPIALKDNLCMAGTRTTCSSRMLENFVSPYDATVVAKIKAAMLPILGKTNLDEFAMGSSTENSAFGPTRNPHDVTRIPGGSSGGSAAAVAAGMAPWALGSDTGGSIRQPASFCGVVGLKPTYGRVSRYGAIAYASSLDQIGPLARTVPDTAALFDAIAGHDPLDHTSLDAPTPSTSAAVAAALESNTLVGLRVGLPAEYLGEGVAAPVRAAFDDACAALTDLGATLVPLSLPHTPYAVATYYLIATAEASSNLARFDGIRYGHRADDPSDLYELYARTRAEGFGPEVKRRILLGTFALSAGYYDAFYGQAQRARTLIRRDFESAFAAVDLIACPVSPVPAWPLGALEDDPLAMYLMDILTIPTNLAGLPALSVPSGLTPPTGTTPPLPIGLQLIGPPLSEHRLLATAALFERARPQAPCPLAPPAGALP